MEYITFRTYLEMQYPKTINLPIFDNWQMVDLYDDYTKRIILPLIKTQEQKQ